MVAAEREQNILSMLHQVCLQPEHSKDCKEREKSAMFRVLSVVSDSDPVSAETTEVRRDTGGSSQEGDHCLRSSDTKTGGLLHGCGQQEHCQDAGEGEGNDVMSSFLSLQSPDAPLSFS